MLKLHWFGSIFVDGASSNLSMIKLWTERRKGAYSVRVDEAEDKHIVKPWFLDPFNGHRVYFVINFVHHTKYIKPMEKEKNAYWIVRICIRDFYPLVEIMPEIPCVLKFAQHNVVRCLLHYHLVWSYTIEQLHC